MTDYTPGFEEWWRTYPSARRKGKVKCFGYWQKRGLEKRYAELVEVLRSQVEHDEQWKKGFIPLSTTYLNEGRYDDGKAKPQRMTHSDTGAEYQKSAPSLKMNWAETALGRLFYRYITTCGALPDCDKALQIHADLMRVDVPALNQDIASNSLSIREAIESVGQKFLRLLDQAYGRNSADRVWRIATTTRSPWR